MSDTLSTFEFFQKFPNEEAARDFFETRRWKKEPVCGHCGSLSVTECKGHKPMAYRCKDCRKHFSVRTGTVLAESRLPLLKWLLAIYMLTSARKGIPSTQMARELGVTQKTAWFLAQRIRETWLKDQGAGDGGDHNQVDETYVGGKRSNMHANKGATVVTDAYRGYLGLPKMGYDHIRIDQSVGEYVKEKAHTNGIESFWALLKRGHYSIYHHMSAKHLHRYVNEFAFRHNTAEVGTMTFINMTIERMAFKRLTYKGLING